MSSFKIPNTKTGSKKTFGVEGLCEFKWVDVHEKEEIGSSSFGVAHKTKFIGETVVVKRLRSEDQQILPCLKRR